MRTKIILLILSFFVKFYISQNNSYRVTYKITYIKDSLEQNTKNEEYSYLYLDNNNSFFLTVNKFKSDSALSQAKKSNFNSTTLLSRPKFNSNFNFLIKKNLKKDSIIYKEKIAGIGNFVYREENTFKGKWNLSSKESLNIIDNITHKAYISYGGRNWTAWYANNISISDGPYKFNGLPGLILKIYDDKKQYVFEAVGIEKINVPEDLDNNYLSQIIITDRLKFNTIKKNYYNNPVLTSGGRMNYTDKEKEKAFIDRMKKNNNFIELK